MFPETEHKCKYSCDAESDAGYLNLLAKNEQTYLSFKGDRAGRVLININEIMDVQVKGLLGNRLVIMSNGRECVFKGSVKTAGRIIMFELEQMGRLGGTF